MQINGNMDVSSALSKLASSQKSENSSDFSDIFSDALNNVKETENKSDQGTLELLAGEESSIHETMIQTEKAELALELALQVRNKVIDAYNEIMRMQL